MELMGKVTAFLSKYRYVVLILVIGVLLMLIPFGEKKQEQVRQASLPAEDSDDTKELTEILSQIKGAGKVSVMLTVKTGKSTVYQNDENVTGGEGGSIRQDTVIVTDENRVQSGLVQHEVAPEYRGAIIVCQGADNPEVRLHIIEAVASVTGLGTDKIAVLKMK